MRFTKARWTLEGGSRRAFLIMADKTKQKLLTKRERKFAELRYRDELTDEEIAKKVGIVRSTAWEWAQRPKIIVEIERLGKADTEKAQRILERASVKAANRLEVLADTKTSEPPLAETGRKAACNILEANKLQKPPDEEKGEKPSLNVYLIQLVQEFRRAASEADGETVNRLIKILEGGNGDEGKQQKDEIGPSPILLRKPLPSQSRKPAS